MEHDENGRVDEAFPLYQEAVAYLLEAVRQGKGDGEQIKRAANSYLTRAEELSLVLDRRKREGVIHTRRISAPPAAARSGAAAHRPSKPDDYDYTGGRAARCRGGAGAAAGGREVVGRGGVSTGSGACKAVNSGRRGFRGPASEQEMLVMEEVLDRSSRVTWEQIAGLEDAKRTLQEAVVLPNLRPDLFKGLRAPPRGVLLFGPPGTGKTLLAKAVASETGFAFFSISASSLVSKYVGEGEKMVRALFSVARKLQPSIIFVDEIESMLGQRNEKEHEASRRLKTEFLVQLDGAGTDSEDHILVMGATNLPWALDEAVLRRLAKKVFIPLPDKVTREALLKNLLKSQRHALKAPQVTQLVELTAGYSCSDVAQVAKDAAMGPIREVGSSALRTVKEEHLRPISFEDFSRALQSIRPSVSQATVQAFDMYMKDNGYT